MLPVGNSPCNTAAQPLLFQSRQPIFESFSPSRPSICFALVCQQLLLVGQPHQPLVGQQLLVGQPHQPLLPSASSWPSALRSVFAKSRLVVLLGFPGGHASSSCNCGMRTAFDLVLGLYRHFEEFYAFEKQDNTDASW